MRKQKPPYINGQYIHEEFINDLIETIIDANVSNDYYNYHIFEISQDTLQCGVFYIIDEYYNLGITIDLLSINQWDDAYYNRNLAYYAELFIENIKLNIDDNE